ncbi:serine hydrolase, partial [Streptomyces cacaoi]
WAGTERDGAFPWSESAVRGAGGTVRRDGQRARASAALGRAVDRLERECGGRLGVAVLGPDGRYAAAHGDRVFVAASVLKTAVLLAVLRRARQERRALTAPERAAAAAMIERSDNDAANTLWRAAGGAAGLAELLDRVGARHTEPEPSGRWGLSRTTANDQLALLRAVFTAGGPVLRPGERAWVRRLMCRVVPEQRWGVPAAGDGTGRPAVKNGWLPRTDTGLWVVHSVGRVTVAGHVHLLAVLSAGHRDFRPGITTVERGARAAVRALAS